MYTRFISGIFIATLLAFNSFDAMAQSSTVGTNAADAVSDSASGWIWDHMFSCGTAATGGVHAGGPGSSGTYIFTGTGITVCGVASSDLTAGGVNHRAAKLRIIVDGQIKAEVADSTGAVNNLAIFVAHNLANQNHALIVEPIGGWAGVSSLAIDHAVYSSDANTSGSADYLAPGLYQVGPRTSPGLGFDLYNFKVDNGSQVGLYTFHQSNNEVIKVTRIAEGKYIMEPLYVPASALTILVNPTDKSLYLGIWQYDHVASQVWAIKPELSGYYTVSSYSDPAYALTSGQINPPFGGVGFTPFDGSVQQDWKFTPTSPGTN